MRATLFVGAMVKIIHVLWSSYIGPVCAYRNPSMAYAHARSMLGVDVAQIELREDLPEIVREDLREDFDGDDDTPQVEVSRTRTIKTEESPPIVLLDFDELDDDKDR